MEKSEKTLDLHGNDGLNCSQAIITSYSRNPIGRDVVEILGDLH